MAKAPDDLSEKEAQKRFEKALRGGLSTPAKPLKDFPKTGNARKAKKKSTK